MPIACTTFHPDLTVDFGYIPHGFWADNTDSPRPMDELAEFAGRNCYQAWERKRPETATNEGYLANIINQGHESVLEHSSVTFYVDAVSRSFTHELIRHRHLSYSELSQRYVNIAETRAVTPPAIRDNGVSFDLVDKAAKLHDDTVTVYNQTVSELEEQGLTRKESRQAARAVMPNDTETKIVVSGNIRAWRDMLKKRYSVHADAEMQEFAENVLTCLRGLSPSSVQDFPDRPFGTKPEEVVSYNA